MSGSWKVTGGQAVSYLDGTYEPGESFEAPEEAVHEAVARGLLVEAVGEKAPQGKK